jgi:hypothetical protein
MRCFVSELPNLWFATLVDSRCTHLLDASTRVVPQSDGIGSSGKGHRCELGCRNGKTIQPAQVHSAPRCGNQRILYRYIDSKGTTKGQSDVNDGPGRYIQGECRRPRGRLESRGKRPHTWTAPDMSGLNTHTRVGMLQLVAHHSGCQASESGGNSDCTAEQGNGPQLQMSNLDIEEDISPSSGGDCHEERVQQVLKGYHLSHGGPGREPKRDAMGDLVPIKLQGM